MIDGHNYVCFLLGPPLEDIGVEDERPTVEEGDSGEEDEMADFIVDDEEETKIGRTPTRYIVNSNCSSLYFNAISNGFLPFRVHPSRERKHKKKSLKQTSGLSLASLAEAQDIFGDVDELLQLRKQHISSTDNDSGLERKLENEYEPSILVEKYLTERDEQIRQNDLPERMQVKSSNGYMYIHIYIYN